MFKNVVLAALMATVLLTAKDDSFTGKWVLDKDASTATCDIPENMRQEIKKKGTNYMIETSWREPKNGIAPLVMVGIMTTLLKLDASGQDTTNMVGPFQQVSKTSINGNQLVTDWTAVINGEHVKGKWTRTLSDDTKSMTLEIAESTADGKSGNGRLIFKRK